MRRKMWRHRITKAGQVSLPADVRHRWETSTVTIEDHGDQVVLRPAPDDPIEALRGALRGKGRTGISSAEALRRWRAEDNASMERKWREYYAE